MPVKAFLDDSQKCAYDVVMVLRNRFQRFYINHLANKGEPIMVMQTRRDVLCALRRLYLRVIKIYCEEPV